MGLTILTVANPFAPLTPDAGDAASLTIAALDGGLVRAGHRSLVLACDGSTVAGTLVPLPRARAGLSGTGQRHVLNRQRALVEEILRRVPVDVVHLHGTGFAATLPPPGVPALVTLHEALGAYSADSLTVMPPGVVFVGVSQAQMNALPDGLLKAGVIGHAMDLDRLAIRVPKKRFAVAVGPVERRSGFHLALEAAAAAGFQLLIAGPESDRAYFDAEIRPRLDGVRRYLGPVGFSRLRWLLGSARCLLVPTLEPDAGPRSALEAMACGTPVVAFPGAELAEVIDPGVTGFLVDDAAAMATAIAGCERLDADVCRAAARARGSADGIVERYLRLYTALAGGVRPESLVGVSAVA